MSVNDITHEILAVRHLTPSTYILRMTRRGLNFQPGQHILLGKPGATQNREYSIYSAEKDDYFEVLIKEVKDGLVSKQLKSLKPGDRVQIEGPMGYFTIEPDLQSKEKFLFIATGTGISPFHSFVKSYPDMDFHILHGVRHSAEAYERHEYQIDKHIVCTSGDKNGDFHGRVTDYLRLYPVHPTTHCYLCGNFNMIYDAFEILDKQGVPTSQVHAEVYF